jgi:hypothetical protein
MPSYQTKALCNLLRHNDPNTTTLTAEQHDYRQIGAALLQGKNTHVTSIGMDLKELYVDQTTNRDSDESLYVANCRNENYLVQKGTECAAALLRYIFAKAPH